MVRDAAGVLPQGTADARRREEEMSVTKKRAPVPLLPMPNGGKDKFDELKFAQSFMRKAPKIIARGDDWFAYDGKAWRPTQRDRFSSTAMDVLPAQHRLARHAEAVLKHVHMTAQLSGEDEMGSAVKFDDTGCVLVNVHNGVLRVSESGVELLPHSADYHFTGCLAASWHEDEVTDAPLFKAVLSQSFSDIKDVMLFQWFAGYCLYPDCKQHEVFLICYGPGGTGKSTLADAVVSAFADDVLVTRLSLAQICSSGAGSYSLPSLQTALVNLGTELDTVEMDESANFKQLVSGEPIVARSIYGKPFKMETTCKLWFLSNALPRFKSGTDAEYRRARFLAFNKKPATKDPTLKDRLREERDGILRWIIDGLQAILGGISAPYGGEASREVMGRFEISNDPVGSFVKQECALDSNSEESKDDVISAFSEFLDAHQFPHKTKEYFFRALYERNPSITVVRYKNKKPAHYLRGIRLIRD
jgi:P4 family phage/plasmid primase-like protien